MKSSTQTFSDANKGFLIYLHIQKTAGITLHRVLRRKIGKSLTRRLVEKFFNRTTSCGISSLKSKKIEDKYYVGHNCFGIHKYLPTPSFYITFVRQPTSRLISLYNYSKINPTAYYHGHAKDKTLEQFLLETPLMELDNGMTRFLAGDREDIFINRTPIGKCDNELLELAKSNLANHFAIAGTTERFDASFLLLCSIMQWTPTYYLKRNPSVVKKKLPALPILREIEEKNHLDMKLFEFVSARLTEDCKRHNIDQETIACFQEKNTRFQSQFGPVYNVYARIKHFARRHVPN